MIWITLAEVGAYLRTEVRSRVGLDEGTGAQLRINFNLSFPHLHCDHASASAPASAAGAPWTVTTWLRRAWLEMTLKGNK